LGGGLISKLRWVQGWELGTVLFEPWLLACPPAIVHIQSDQLTQENAARWLGRVAHIVLNPWSLTRFPDRFELVANLINASHHGQSERFRARR
jgi:hypothetical protein